MRTRYSKYTNLVNRADGLDGVNMTDAERGEMQRAHSDIVEDNMFHGGDRVDLDVDKVGVSVRVFRELFNFDGE